MEDFIKITERNVEYVISIKAIESLAYYEHGLDNKETCYLQMPKGSAMLISKANYDYIVSKINL